MPKVITRFQSGLCRCFVLPAILLSGPVHADDATESADQLREQILQRFVAGICYQEFVDCIGIEQADCSEAARAAADTCPIEALHDAIESLPPGLPGPSEEMAQAGAEFGTCLADGWRARLGVDLNDHPQCELRRGGASSETE